MYVWCIVLWTSDIGVYGHVKVREVDERSSAPLCNAGAEVVVHQRSDQSVAVVAAAVGRVFVHKADLEAAPAVVRVDAMELPFLSDSCLGLM